MSDPPSTRDLSPSSPAAAVPTEPRGVPPQPPTHLPKPGAVTVALSPAASAGPSTAGADLLAPGRSGEPTDGELRYRIGRLALPVIGEQFLFMLVGIVDLAIAGQLDDPTPVQAGLAMATLLSWLTSTVFSAVGIGATAMVSRATGAGDRALASELTRQSLLPALAGGLLVAVGMHLSAGGITAAMGLTGASAGFAEEWLRLTGWAWVPFAVNVVGSACLRGAGDTRTPLWVMTGVNGANLVLAVVLTFGAGPVPAMGAAGIGWATAVARAGGGVALLVILLSGRTRLHVRATGFRPDGGLIGRLLRIGLPGGVETLLAAAGMTLFYRMIAGLPDAETCVAAHGMAVRTEGLSYLPGFGFSVAAATMVGQSLGAGRPEFARRAARQAFLLAASVMTGMAVVFFTAADPLLRIFAPDQDHVRAAAATALRTAAFAQFGQAAAFVFAGCLRGAGDTGFPMLSTGGGLLLVRVPLTWVLAFGAGFGLAGAWMAMAADLTVRGTANWLRFRSGRWTGIEVLPGVRPGQSSQQAPATAARISDVTRR